MSPTAVDGVVGRQVEAGKDKRALPVENKVSQKVGYIDPRRAAVFASVASQTISGSDPIDGLTGTRSSIDG